jgi:hypothetical protein
MQPAAPARARRSDRGGKVATLLGRVLINRDWFGNRWLPQTTCANCALDVQAIFCRRRHQARRPPPAKIRPGRPAPAIGPGTTQPATVEKKPGTIGSLRKTVISRRNLWHIHLLPKRSHALSRSSHRWLPSPVLAQGGGQLSRFQSRGSRRCPPPPWGEANER